MPLSLNDFTRQLIDSGLLSQGDVAACLGQASATDAEELARWLVRQKKLTAFQAQQCYARKGKTLVLGNYVVLDKLGQGGMGVVLKAEHRRMKRLVAIKVLSPAVTKTEILLQRFQREVEAAARLTHPNIVQAFDADELHGLHFLVMEYVPGKDLASLVKQQGPLPPGLALNCIYQAAKGLEYAHQQGVVHRDIKPANLLLDERGQLKILDMGLARLLGEGDQQHELTTTGAVMGTVDYMAPEQAESTRTAGVPADIYSLGCTLFYLLLARPVYGGENLMQRLLAHRDQPIPSLQELRAEVPAEIDALFARMVAKSPADRPESMTEVIARLDRWKLVPVDQPGRGAMWPVRAGEPEQVEGFSVDVSGSEVGQVRAIPLSTVSDAPGTPEDAPTSISTQASMPTQLLATSVAMDKPPDELRKSRQKNWKSPGRLAGIGAVCLLICGAIAVVIFPRTSKESALKLSAGPVAESLEPTAVVASTARSGKTPPTLTTTPGITKQGSAAEWFEFDGLADFIRVPSLRINTDQPFTVETWVKIPPRQAVSPAFIVSPVGNSAGGPNDLVFGLTHWHERAPGEGDFRFGVQHRFDVRSIKIRSQELYGKPVHLAGVSEGDDLRIFIDGRRVQPEGVRYAVPEGRAVQDFTVIGGAPYGRRFFEGAVKELRFSSSARYLEDFAPPPSRLENDEHTLALYRFSELTGRVLPDSSDHGHEGTLYRPCADVPMATADENRQVAEWILRHGGKVQLLINGVPTEISQVQQLPAGAWWIEGIVVPERSEIRNTDLTRFNRLSRLRSLSVQHPQISGEGITLLEFLPRLEHFDFAGSGCTPQDLTCLSQQAPGFCSVQAARASEFTPTIYRLSSLLRLSRLELAVAPTRDELLEFSGLLRLREIRVPASAADSGEEWQQTVQAYYERAPQCRITIAGQIQGASQHPEIYRRLSAAGWTWTDRQQQTLDLSGEQVTMLPEVGTIRPPREASASDVQQACNVAYDATGFSARGCPITDEMMAWISRLPWLTRLDLSQTQVTYVTVEKLVLLSLLEHLDLSQTQVSDNSLRALGGLRNLKTLSVAQTQLTDVGVQDLAVCLWLEVLDLSGTSITDQAVESLAKFKRLQRLDLRDTGLGAAGIDRLRAALPDCEVLANALQ